MQQEAARVGATDPDQSPRNVPGELFPGRLAALPPGRLIFSDVDGTFLTDEGRVPFDRAFLNHVRDRYRVVFASSRTTEELQTLQRQLGWSDPFIAEDGHVLGLGDGRLEHLGLTQEALIARLRQTVAWPDVAALLVGHPESTQWRLASLLLPRAVAEDSRYEGLRGAIAGAGLSLTIGGDWSVLGSGGSKAAAADRLMAIERLQPQDMVAIGNEANDEGLLRAFPTAFVIRNAAGYHPRLAAIPGATRCHADGPAGWLEMIDALDRDDHTEPEAD